MSSTEPTPFYRRIVAADICVRKVCEVGVYLPETSNVLAFAESGIATLLVEPDPKSLAAIRKRFANRDNVDIHPVAIYDRTGKLRLSRAEASTFVSELPDSPAQTNDAFVVAENDSFEVDCTVFSAIDPGDIDALSVDTEGSEWYVLATMVSRPGVISIETHGKYYVNPFIEKIMRWMKSNGYSVWYKDKTDTVFVRRGVLSLSAGQRMRNLLFDGYLALRRSRRHLRRSA